MQSAIAMGQISKEDAKEILDSLRISAKTKNDRAFLSPQQGRKIVGVSLPTFFKFTKEHNIPARKVGRQNRYLETDILKAMGVSEVA